MYAKCQKCGKKLTDPESMRRGYGPECWEQLTGIRVDFSGNAPESENIAGQMNITDFPEWMPGRDEYG